VAEQIIILGASARAAAFSALRAGFAPWTADLFADADLAARCPAQRVQRYPADLESAAREAPPGPWLYTGALENYPELVERIAAVRPLWGNRGETLRRVRDPWKVRSALLAGGLPSPGLARRPEDLSPGVWLRKPRRGAGGAHVVRIAVGAAKRRGAGPHEPPGAVYYQQFIPGIPTSAVFVAARGRAVLLGVTRQLIGAPWTGARGFQYAGSAGPLLLSEAEGRAWRRIGACLARRFELSGLFGVDAVAHREGIFPVEVNPRYTASIEVLEESLGFAGLAFHAAACRDGRLPPEPLVRPRRFCGKVILYARRSGPAGPAFWEFIRASENGNSWPAAADLPRVGEVFQSGRPVLTLLGQGPSGAAVLRDLRRRAHQAFQLLGA
jgi:uncharacterized protein